MKAKKLLIIHQGALGDVVLTFPAIPLLKKEFRRADGLCQSKLGKLACDLQVLDGWFPVESASFASLYTNTVDISIKKIIRSYSDIVLFSFSTILEAAIKNIAEGNLYRIPPRPDPRQKIHVARHILSCLKRFGLPGKTDDDPTPTEPPTHHPKKPNVRFNSPRILIHPGSGSREKNWPVSNFLKISAALQSFGLNPEFILGPAEYFLLEKLKQQNKRIHLIDKLTDIANLFKSAGGFIGNDSGVSHLAAFMGLPTVAVFGPSDPERWKPVGRSVKVVRPDLDCSPCFETGQKVCENMECFDKTSPETVLNTFYSLVCLNRTNPS